MHFEGVLAEIEPCVDVQHVENAQEDRDFEPCWHLCTFCGRRQSSWCCNNARWYSERLCIWEWWQMRWHVAEPDRLICCWMASCGGLQWVQDRQRIWNRSCTSEPQNPRGGLWCQGWLTETQTTSETGPTMMRAGKKLQHVFMNRRDNTSTWSHQVNAKGAKQAMGVKQGTCKESGWSSKKKWKTVVAFDRNTEQLHRKNKTTFYLVIESGSGVHEYKVKAKDKERNQSRNSMYTYVIMWPGLQVTKLLSETFIENSNLYFESRKGKRKVADFLSRLFFHLYN